MRALLIAAVLLLVAACVPEGPTFLRPDEHQTYNPGGAALGEACGPDHYCGTGLGCSGLYYNESGTCITDAEAKVACEAKNGEWGRPGLLQIAYCLPKLPDAGKPCTDNDECAGYCIEDNPGQGHCQYLATQFGCFTSLNHGKPNVSMCVD